MIKELANTDGYKVIEDYSSKILDKDGEDFEYIPLFMLVYANNEMDTPCIPSGYRGKSKSKVRIINMSRHKCRDYSLFIVSLNKGLFCKSHYWAKANG